MGYLIFYLLLEPIKRILSALLYPIAYLCRNMARDRGLLKGILWADYLYNPLFIPVWLFLDDSVVMEFGKEYGDREKYYPSFIWATGSDFLKAYWWAAIRNSCVNWNNYSAFKTGEYIRTIKRYGSDRNFYEVRLFPIGERPYCEFWIFGRRNQVGWIRKGRFEIDVMKKRTNP